MVAPVVVQRRRCGRGSGRQSALEGAVSARYFMARWKGCVGSVRLMLVDCSNFVCAVDLSSASVGLRAFTLLRFEPLTRHLAHYPVHDYAWSAELLLNL